jgi:ribosomal protection tetracycline resistance protein
MTSNRIVLGILAHVDAGKTTLSEGILYETGTIRKVGRVDDGEAFLDTFALEKQRGITIFSKQAEFSYQNRSYTLLDTPGHVDFSPEMERTLQVLDAAILVISAPDGVNAQVRRLFELLEHYGVPVFLFLNKMDQAGPDRAASMSALQSELSDRCVDVSGGIESDAVQEQLALADEEMMESYLAGNPVTKEAVCELVCRRLVYPVYFGSALKREGIKELLGGLHKYLAPREFPDTFGARVFKISRDEQGNRLTWVRVTGGILRVKDSVLPEEKVNQIRVYSGASFEAVQSVSAGEVAALTGLSATKPGMGLGEEPGNEEQLLSPIYRSEVIPAPDVDTTALLKAFRQLGEEEPMLQVKFSPDGAITVAIMGEVQTEVLSQMLLDRFGMNVKFGPPVIQYKETIARPAEGVGHFEPLRHYAEVHLYLEPGEPGSGVTFASRCGTDELAGNWQRLILGQLSGETFRGVLIGAELTDVKITLIGGRAHEKHTEGGDFRQAALRAVRQGEMMAKLRLLEPVLKVRLTMPDEWIGRAMNDLTQMSAAFEAPLLQDGSAVLTGTVPASEFSDYPIRFRSYTGGQGSIETQLAGYFPCHDADRVIEECGYDPERDTEFPSSSVFCSHGAGVIIPWDEVRGYMHVDTGWRPGLILSPDGWKRDSGEALSDLDAEQSEEELLSAQKVRTGRKQKEDAKLSFKEREKLRGAAEQELKEIFERTYGAVKDQNGRASSTLDRHMEEDSLYDRSWRDYQSRKQSGRTEGSDGRKTKQLPKPKETLLIVDGYNVIYAWNSLRALAQVNLDSARDALIEKLSAYHGASGIPMLLVFDGYRVRGNTGTALEQGEIDVVYTREDQTADAYIEKKVHEVGHTLHVFVASSDGLVQTIVLGEGAARVTAKELETMIQSAQNALAGKTAEFSSKSFSKLKDRLPEEMLRALREES